MESLRVVARFIRINHEIINVLEIARVHKTTEFERGGIQKHTHTIITFRNGNDMKVKYKDLVDEIWEILQAGSEMHLSP